MILQARLSAITAREPKPTEKSRDLDRRARAILSYTPKPAGQDSKSLKALLRPPPKAGFDPAAFRAAGCDPASAQAAGYDVPSLVAAYGFDAVEGARLWRPSLAE